MSQLNSLSLEQYAGFIAAVIDALPWDIDPGTAQAWMRDREALTRVLREALSSPLRFSRNKHGHIILEFKGHELIGREEIERLTPTVLFSELASLCFLSEMDGCYNNKHLLARDKDYKVVLMPVDELVNVNLCTDKDLCNLGINEFGYKRPLAGIVPRMCELFSGRQLEEMGFRYIAVPSDPIIDGNGVQRMLEVDIERGSLIIHAPPAQASYCWPKDGAYAFEC